MSSERRTIRIDEDVHAFLQRHAEAPSDTPNSVLRRLLGLPTETRTSETTNAVLAALRAHPGTNATELATHSGIGYSTTARILNNLENDGLARHTQAPKRPAGHGVPANHWWPTDTNPTDDRSAPANQTSDMPSEDRNTCSKGESLT